MLVQYLFKYEMSHISQYITHFEREHGVDGGMKARQSIKLKLEIKEAAVDCRSRMKECNPTVRHDSVHGSLPSVCVRQSNNQLLLTCLQPFVVVV